MLDLVRGYYTTSMALYPDEKRTWQELHHALLLQQMLEHFLKGWPVLFVFHLDSKVAHSDTVWILHLLLRGNIGGVAEDTVLRRLRLLCGRAPENDASHGDAGG